MSAPVNFQIIEDILRYENGEMEEAEVLDLFQRLVDCGLAWTLQGAYGRQANEFIKQGLIVP